MSFTTTTPQRTNEVGQEQLRGFYISAIIVSDT